jgi:argininosuccinate synthase
MSPAEVLAELNRIGGANGIGRADIVENRYVGMKSRGCYETPGGTIMLKAHRAMESLTLDREAAHLKDELMPRYAELIYNGYWFSPEREMLQAAIDQTQQVVNGDVRLKLYKGNVLVVGRRSETNSLFDESIATFEEDAGAYDQGDATGFIRLNALRLRVQGRRAAPSSASGAMVVTGWCMISPISTGASWKQRAASCRSRRATSPAQLPPASNTGRWCRSLSSMILNAC